MSIKSFLKRVSLSNTKKNIRVCHIQAKSSSHVEGEKIIIDRATV
jgi:hypothetical protein